MIRRTSSTDERRPDTRRRDPLYEESGGGILLLRLPQQEHLATEHRDYACCEHRWATVPLDVALPGATDARKELQEIFAETDLGDRQTVCTRCKALALWERGEIFAYDAMVLEAERPSDRRPARGRR